MWSSALRLGRVYMLRVTQRREEKSNYTVRSAKEKRRKSRLN